MYSIDPSALTERENYKFMIGSIIPRPIAFVTSMSKASVLNGAPFSYFNIVSANPPMISLAVQRRNGKQKDTARNIIESREFVVHATDRKNVEKVNQTAATLPPEQSEVSLAGLTPISSTTVSVPGIKESAIRMECVLETSIELGGGEETSGTDLIIGRIIRFHIDKDLYEEGKIDAEKLAAVSRLAGASYAEIGKTFDLLRPK